MTMNPADILFSPATRAVQERYGSRDTIARLEMRGHWKSRLSEDVISLYALATHSISARQAVKADPIYSTAVAHPVS